MRGVASMRGRVSLLLCWGAAGCMGEGAQSALAPDGPAARAIVDLWWALLLVSLFVVLLVWGLLAWALMRRRSFPSVRPPLPLSPDARAGHVAAGLDDETVGVALDTHADEGRSVRWVLAAGVAFPTVVLVPLFVFALWTLGRIGHADAASELVIEVTGRQYWWAVRYLTPGAPSFSTANEIHIPVGRPVLIRLRSEDVIHSFWVPRLAPKLDNVPGRTTELWLHADEPGTYRGQCAEYCGVQHAHMAFLVIAESEPELSAWMERERAPAAPPPDSVAAAGPGVFAQAGCAACHTVRGTPAAGTRGPDLTHVASRRTLAAGLLPNTPAHLTSWIAGPQAAKPGNLMPVVPLAPGQLDVLVRYLSSLR